jgi:hypothetical protein
MAKSVQTLLEDIRLLGATQCDIVQAVRTLISKQFSSSSAASSPTRSTSRSSSATAPRSMMAWGFLKAGKWRRHIKLKSASDIAGKHLPVYLKLAHEAAQA